MHLENVIFKNRSRFELIGSDILLQSALYDRVFSQYDHSAATSQ